jgi:mannitol/fructose-specific phosphotransferase system IIA component (Ntr-type)
MENSQKYVFAGIIIPHSWDENGKVDGVALYTDKEEVYTLADSRLTQALMRFMQKTVEIKGQIREHPNGSKSIAAKGYRVLE